MANAEREAQSRGVRLDLEEELADVVPRELDDTRTLAAYARSYEEIRKALAPGPDRTWEMSKLVAVARAIARRAKIKKLDIRQLFQAGTLGGRVIALALVRDQPDPELIDPVLDGIVNSRSAFEQYQALMAAVELQPTLPDPELKRLYKALDQAMANPQAAIDEDASRARLVEALRESLYSTGLFPRE